MCDRAAMIQKSACKLIGPEASACRVREGQFTWLSRPVFTEWSDKDRQAVSGPALSGHHEGDLRSGKVIIRTAQVTLQRADRLVRRVR